MFRFLVFHYFNRLVPWSGGGVLSSKRFLLLESDPTVLDAVGLARYTQSPFGVLWLDVITILS